jgi:hypothetical protein
MHAILDLLAFQRAVKNLILFNVDPFGALNAAVISGLRFSARSIAWRSAISMKVGSGMTSPRALRLPLPAWACLLGWSFRLDFFCSGASCRAFKLSFICSCAYRLPEPLHSPRHNFHNFKGTRHSYAKSRSRAPDPDVPRDFHENAKRFQRTTFPGEHHVGLNFAPFQTQRFTHGQFHMILETRRTQTVMVSPTLMTSSGS